MNTIGNIPQLFGARPALIVAISLIITFSIRKAENIRISFILVVFGAFLAAVPVSVVFLVTNGDLSLLNLGRVGGWADRAAIGLTS